MSEISKKLKDLYLEVAENIDFVNPFLENPEALEKVIVISTNIRNKAPIRFLLSCLAAKLDRPDVDIRKPYTQIGEGSFSGRFYDERYVQEIISEFNFVIIATYLIYATVLFIHLYNKKEGFVKTNKWIWFLLVILVIGNFLIKNLKL